MAEKLSIKDKGVALLISRAALRMGRKLDTATGDDLTRVVGSLSLLNQAQLMVEVDTKMARRLLDKSQSKKGN